MSKKNLSKVSREPGQRGKRKLTDEEVAELRRRLGITEEKLKEWKK